jgi:catechol 2,3-dioxygenase-like lactoylglutathione lyase family enzyme
MIKQIKLAGIFVNDPDQAYEFYVGELGFEVKEDQAMGEGGRSLELVPPGAQTRLAVSTLLHSQTEARVGGSTNIVFSTEDIHATYEKLAARGVKFTDKPTRQVWGGIQGRFADPDGNVFLLVQEDD